MFIVTAEQMRAVDEHTIHQLGIPAASLMENAGRAIAEEVIKLCREGQEAGWLANSGQVVIAVKVMRGGHTLGQAIGKVMVATSSPIRRW